MSKAHKLLIPWLVMGLFLFSQPSLAQELEFQLADFNLAHEHIAAELLVKFADWAPQDLVDESLKQLGEVMAKDQASEVLLLKLDGAKVRQVRAARQPRAYDTQGRLRTEVSTTKAGLEILSLNPLVEFVEPNFVAHALSVPNDPLYKYQWNFKQLGLETAWDSTQGEGAIVAVIDSGVAYERYSRFRQAPELDGVQIVAPFNFIWNNNRANDDNGHGTHVAGTIVSATNNGNGVAGVAYKASLMPLKALDQTGAGTYYNIARAVRYAADNGADVINLSLGGPVGSYTLEDAVRYASNIGALVVASSGNDGGSSVLYPAAYDQYVLAIGSVRYDKSKASYSTYGASLDLVAPGGDISIDQSGDGYADGILQQTLKQRTYSADPKRFDYYFYQGTSMAAPHVAGVAALVKSLGVSDLSTLKQILLDSAEDLSTPGWDPKTGHGLVRADKAVELALQKTEDGEQKAETENSSSQPKPSSEPSTPSNPTDPSSPPEEEPASEPEPEPEPAQPTLELALDTYNMFGRKDSAYAFWESAYLGLEVKNAASQLLPGVSLAIEVLNSSGDKIATGSGQSNSEGELWLKLGTFARGSYDVVVTALLDGFQEVVEKTSFRFR